jgi:mRNA interferase MazF
VKRGDVYLADLNPTKGSEQSGRRPVLIYQNDRLIQAGQTVIVIPFTTNLKRRNLPSCVLIPAPEGGLKEDSVALCHQIRALDRSGILDYWGSLSVSRLAEVNRVVLHTLGL